MKKTMKLMTALMMAVMLLTTMCVTAFADGNVTYEGNAKEFIFAPGSDYSPTDLFADFKGVMPGDQLTQQLVIKNTAGKQVTVRIYMRALGAQEGSEEFLNQMNLTVTGKGELFNASADQTAQLTDWVLLGEFSSGDTKTLDVTLDVPLTMDNDFQSNIGYLDWQFKAEEIPVPEKEPDENYDNDTETNSDPADKGDKEKEVKKQDDKNESGPKTGDTMNVALWGGVSVVCVLGIVFVVVKNRKEHEEQ